MKPLLLPEQDRRQSEEACNQTQQGRGRTAIDMAVTTVLGLAGLATLGIEAVIGFRVFSDLFAPDVPGEAAHGPVALMACTPALAAAAFHLYLSKNPDALAARLLNRCVPWLALGFIASMGLMATRGFLEHNGLGLFGQKNITPDLFADVSHPADVSFFDRFVTSAFGFGLAGLALLNFWATQQIIDRLRNRLEGMAQRRALAKETQALMDEVNDDEAQLLKLEAERQAWLAELEPQASRVFATELAALVQGLRGPVAGVIAGETIWKKRKESVIERQNEPELDMAKFKELAAASDLTSEKILAAFEGLPERARK